MTDDKTEDEQESLGFAFEAVAQLHERAVTEARYMVAGSVATIAFLIANGKGLFSQGMNTKFWVISTIVPFFFATITSGFSYWFFVRAERQSRWTVALARLETSSDQADLETLADVNGSAEEAATAAVICFEAGIVLIVLRTVLSMFF